MVSGTILGRSLDSRLITPLYYSIPSGWSRIIKDIYILNNIHTIIALIF